jgi:hypothetical protein
VDAGGAIMSGMTAHSDEELARALVHDAHVILDSDAPGNLGREDELDHVKRGIRLADKLLAGTATDEERASVGDFVHPQVRSLYLSS